MMIQWSAKRLPRFGVSLPRPVCLPSSSLSCWSTLLVSLLESARGLGTLSPSPGHRVGTAELTWRCLCAPPWGCWWPVSSRICHVGSALELPKRWAWLKAERLQLSGHGRDPARLHKADGLKIGTNQKTSKKWGVLWTQGGTLDFLNSVPRQWRKTGFSRAHSSGFCVKLGSGALLLYVVLAEDGPYEHLQSIWHEEQLSCTKQVSTECQQKMRRMKGNFSISGVIPYSFVWCRMRNNGE